MAEFRMPSLGADMEQGTVVEWRVAPGDTVHRGDIVAVVDTDKADIEVEIFEDGVIDELRVAEGEEVPVGTVLATLRTPAGSTGTDPARGPSAPAGLAAPAVSGAPAGRVTSAEAAEAAESAGPVEPAGEVAATSSGVPSPSPTRSPVIRRLADRLGIDLAGVVGTGPDGTVTRADVERAAVTDVAGATPAGREVRVAASPQARRLAAERGVDLAAVTGTGPAGAVVAHDVEAAAARTTTAPAKATASSAPAIGRAREDRSESMRRAVGELMARSKRDIPHYYLSTTIDLRAATAWLDGANADRRLTERIVPAALLLAATARASLTVPRMNGHFLDGALRPADTVHLGVAVSLRGGGLVAPAIVDAQELSPTELMTRLRDLVTRARQGALRGSEMIDPTITVTNLGDQGVEAVYGVIYPPQVALVGFGRVVERPWAVDGMIGAHPVVTATLAADHRASDGHDGARLLETIDRLLQHPEDL